MKWQPIETAPKRGVKRVDLYGMIGRKGKRVPDCYWHKKAQAWMCDHYDKSGYSRLRLPFTPTHWRLTPKPPEPNHER